MLCNSMHAVTIQSEFSHKGRKREKNKISCLTQAQKDSILILFSGNASGVQLRRTGSMHYREMK